MAFAAPAEKVPAPVIDDVPPKRTDPLTIRERTLVTCICRYEALTSGGYRAISPDGKYTGCSQWDDQTWASVGGKGRARDAPPLEQDLRTIRLYEDRGLQPWSVEVRKYC